MQFARVVSKVNMCMVCKDIVSCSLYCTADTVAALQSSSDQIHLQQPDQAIRAEPNGPPPSPIAEGVKVNITSQDQKKSSRKLEKKSSRDSKRDEAERKPSRAKRRRSRSRSRTRSPKR